MKRGLFYRNFLATTAMFAVCFLVFGLTMLMMGRAYLVNERREKLKATEKEVELLAAAMLQQDGLLSLELRMSLSAISQCSGEHILLCDSIGMVVSTSDFQPVSPYVGVRLQKEVVETLRSGGYSGLSDLGGLYAEQRYIESGVLGDPDMPEGYVVVSCAANDYLDGWSGFVTSFLLIALGVLVLAAVLQYISARRLTKPLHEMADAANRYARGDYSARVDPYDEDDEIGTLTEAFNGMAESLELNETRRREFVANVSHELRTPMTTISGFADGILDGTIPREQERKYLEKISSETKRLSRLVRTMLDMSRLRGDDPEKRMTRFDLCEMVVQTVLGFEERVDKKHLRMELDVPEDGLAVRGDLDALTRVVYNLMDNAVKFADEGTAVTVSVWKENGRAYTCVQDRGATIPRAELPLIFDRFHKSDRSRSMDRDGVGLGLYMVREIIAAHKQDIFVTSEDGVTAFTFTLELADSPAKKEREGKN